VSYWLSGWQPPWGIEYAIDLLNGFVLVIVSFIGVVVVIFSKRSIEHELYEKTIPFYTIYTLLLTGLLGITVTGDLFNLYVFLEIASLASYALIAVARGRALIASFYYLVLGTVGATFILIGIGYLYISTGSLNMADLSERLPELYSSKTVQCAIAFFLVGLAIKCAIFPLHTWLPPAYTHAPSAVSAILAATSTKVGLYCLIRVLFFVFDIGLLVEKIPTTEILCWLSFCAIIFGSVMAIVQKNIKTTFAYSSVAQIGYIALGIGIATKLSLTGSLIHILNHALMKCSLFLVAGAVFYKIQTQEIADYEGLGKKMPWTMSAFCLALLSMIGVPPTVGFVSKWCLLTATVAQREWIYAAALILSSLAMVIYFGRIIEKVWWPKIEVEPERENLPITMVFPILITAVLCLVLGIVSPLQITEQIAEVILWR
jgi:multicomponent Na+:H+ antiporter subunit D